MSREKWLPPNPIPEIKERPTPENSRIWLMVIDTDGDPLDFEYSGLDQNGPSSAEMSVPFLTYRKMTRIFTDVGRRINNITITDAMPILEEALIFIRGSNTDASCPDYDERTRNSYRGSVWALYELCRLGCYHRDKLKMDDPVIKIRRT